MKQNNGESFEFEEIPCDALSVEIGRRFYRVPVRKKMNFSVVINATRYPLLDISSNGIRIAVEPTTSIASQDVISCCELVLDEQIFSALEGKVVHYSLEDDENWICGIKWLNIDADTENDIGKILLILRKELFKHD